MGNPYRIAISALLCGSALDKRFRNHSVPYPFTEHHRTLSWPQSYLDLRQRVAAVNGQGLGWASSDGNEHMKRHSTSLMIKEMEIKTTMRYHPTLIRMAIIKKNTSNKFCWECGEKGIFVHYWWECKLVQPLQKTLWSFLKKLEIEWTHDLAILLLGIYMGKTKTLIQKKMYAL